VSVFNIYCDESCHLPNDGQTIMTLGLIWCPLDKTREIAIRLREIKARHNLASDFEIKWTKVSPSKVLFYQDIIDYFFDDDDLHFRSVVIQKSEINHDLFNQTHEIKKTHGVQIKYINCMMCFAITCMISTVIL